LVTSTTEDSVSKISDAAMVISHPHLSVYTYRFRDLGFMSVLGSERGGSGNFWGVKRVKRVEMTSTQPRWHLITIGWSILTIVSQKNLTSCDVVLFLATHAEFVIPYEKYITSIRNPICIGTRFIMRFEMNDSPERCAGVVAGVYDLDPYRWPNSKWCDGMSLVSDHQERVSLWEIDPSVSLPHLSIQSSPRPWEIDPSSTFAGILDHYIGGLRSLR
ncbi:predicted protein, partial [Arabidopsis lyrata subsp. lyrata]